ncbi:MAG: hypothetical protein GX643_16025 [Acidimicrobiales bacterium]|nr:hypothetical protein [Acidimicrobiales bacterium]
MASIGPDPALDDPVPAQEPPDERSGLSDAAPSGSGDARARIEVTRGRSRAERRAAERHESRERLVEAAIQAELATGDQEATLEQAKRHVVVRLATIAVGFVVLLGGLVMIVLPGPGVVGILAGLGILSRELPWAERVMEYVKKRAKLDELKEQPRWVQAVMWTVTVCSVVGSVAYFTVFT